MWDVPTISNIGVSTPCEPKLRIDTALNWVFSTFKSLWSHNLVWEPVWRHKCTIVSVFTAMPKMHQCCSSELPRLYRGRCWNSLKTWHFSEKTLPQKTSSSPIPLLVQGFCLRGDTYHSRQYCSKYPHHHLWMMMELWCGHSLCSMWWS